MKLGMRSEGVGILEVFQKRTVGQGHLIKQVDGKCIGNGNSVVISVGPDFNDLLRIVAHIN